MVSGAWRGLRPSCAWPIIGPRRPPKGDTPIRESRNERGFASAPAGGFEPDNLLAFLALLGLLRSLESARPTWRPRAAWDLDRAPLRPILLFAEPHAQRAVSEAAAEGVGRLAELY